MRDKVFREAFKYDKAVMMLLAVLVLFTGFVGLAGYSFCAVQALPMVVITTWRTSIRSKTGNRRRLTV